VQGASYRHAEQIETVALFNESCNRNYISSKFAKNRLRILDNNREEDVDSDCWLVWVCEGLGRYQQRTVFWIAKDADFDLLFGYEQNQNTHDHQHQQFQNGINNGTLKTELPRWKSFQGGIKDDFLLPVGWVADGNYLSGSPRMPSLADIKGQLADQLGSSSERRRQHDREKALNTFDPSHISDWADFFCSEDPNDSMAPVIIEMPQRDKFNLLSSGPLPIDDSEQLINDIFKKGNKRTHQEPRSSSLTGEPEELHRLPKVRSVRVGRSGRRVAANLLRDETPLKRENPNTNGGLLSSHSNSLSTASAKKQPVVVQGPDMSRVIQGPPSRRSTAGMEGELLFSGMDRGDSPCTSTLSRTSSFISLSSKSLHNQPILRESVTIEADIGNPIYRPKRKAKKSRRRPKIIDKPFISTVGCHDEKFHEFWKRDEERGNWYHVDKITSKVTWYEAPPWSTLPSGANNTLSEASSLA
jgi:hypothetical protein